MCCIKNSYLKEKKFQIKKLLPDKAAEDWWTVAMTRRPGHRWCEGEGMGTGERTSPKNSPVTSLAVVSLGGWMGLIAACWVEL